MKFFGFVGVKFCLMVLCNVTTNGFRDRYLHLGGKYYLYIQGRYVDKGRRTFHILFVPKPYTVYPKKCQLFENIV
jgi:hypothetical protein